MTIRGKGGPCYPREGLRVIYVFISVALICLVLYLRKIILSKIFIISLNNVFGFFNLVCFDLLHGQFNTDTEMSKVPVIVGMGYQHSTLFERRQNRLAVRLQLHESGIGEYLLEAGVVTVDELTGLRGGPRRAHRPRQLLGGLDQVLRHRAAVQEKRLQGLQGRKEMFYLTTHSTHFIYGYMERE